MKITNVNYKNQEVRFVVDTYPDKSFCVLLTEGMTKKDVTNQLNVLVANAVDKAEVIYNNLNLKSLEGSDL